MKHWLMKSEPDVFSISDLRVAPKKTTAWDGVRNYQARNFMRDDMKKGDLVFFYHSNCEVPGIYGIARVSREAYPDETAFQRGHEHFDPKSRRDSPTWVVVDVTFVREFARPVSLETLKAHQDRLPDMLILRRGNRLSVTPVTLREWEFINSLV
jgi:predicted RNA-binding protein with PUA-like domain